jgi:hypothetical protein
MEDSKYLILRIGINQVLGNSNRHPTLLVPFGLLLIMVLKIGLHFIIYTISFICKH